MCVFTFYFVSGIICSEITGPLRIYNSRGNGKISLNFNCQLNVKIRNMCSRHTAENNRKMNVQCTRYESMSLSILQYVFV